VDFVDGSHRLFWLVGLCELVVDLRARFFTTDEADFTDGAKGRFAVIVAPLAQERILMCMRVHWSAVLDRWLGGSGSGDCQCSTVFIGVII